MISAPSWLTRSAGKATKAVNDLSDYFSGLVTLRDRSKSHYTRNQQALQLLPYARGYVMNCAHIVANACSQQPLRLYSVGSVTIERRGKHRVKRYAQGTKPVPMLHRKAFESGRMGKTKAATWSGVGGNVAEVTDHPVLDLITRPNPFQNGEAFDYQAFLFAQVVGEMFTLASDAGGVPQLWPMLPQYTEPMPDVEEVVRGYAYGRERSAVNVYDAGDVLHFKYSDHIENPYHGMGPLHHCYQAARIVAENEDFDYEMIDSGNLPLAFITLDPNHYSTPDAVNDFKKYMDKVTRGARGKARAIVGVGLGISTGMPTAKDLQSLEKLATHKATIRQAFNVPEALLELNSANLASATEAMDQFWNLCGRPLLNRRADHLTENLLPMMGLEPGRYFLSYDDPTLDDTRAEAEVANLEIGMGALSINEYRESRNLPGIGEDGDVYRINGVPVNQSGQMPAAPQPFMLAANKSGRDKMTVPVVGKVNARKDDDAGDYSQSGVGYSVGSGGGSSEFADRHQQYVGQGKAGNTHGGEGEVWTGGSTERNARTDCGTGRHGMDDDEGGGENHCSGNSQAAEQCCQSGGERALASKLAHCHARPDPYDLRDCGCGLSTKDDDDDDDISAVSVPAKLISAEQAAKQTQVLRAGVGSLRDVVEDFMLDAQRRAASRLRLQAGTTIGRDIFDDTLATKLEPAFREMYEAGFDLAGLELEPDANEGGDRISTDPFDRFAVVSEEAIEQARGSLLREVVDKIEESTLSQIETRIRQGIESGQTVDEIAGQIESDTGMAKYRAERIARTEVSQAANAGKRERYKAAGITKVYWVTAPGASAVHRAIEAKFPKGQDIDKPFLKAGQTITAGGESETYRRDIYAPPARPNCRCMLQTRKVDRPTEGDQ